jgi:hypothetical protein
MSGWVLRLLASLSARRRVSGIVQSNNPGLARLRCQRVVDHDQALGEGG